jgi:hypothetical protein
MKFTSGSFASNADYEVQRTNHYEVTIYDLPGTQGMEIKLSAESVKIPSLNIEPIELKHGNQSVKVAGAASVEGGDFVIKDFVGIDTEKTLYDWYSKVYNQETELIGNAVDYKKRIKLAFYSPDNTIIRSWDLKGCFPTSFDAGEGNYEGSDKRMVTMTMSVDKAIRLDKETV